MINLYEKFIEYNRTNTSSQYPLNYADAVVAYYGVNKDGNYRISFYSSKNSEIKGITKNITIVQGPTNDGHFWTCFDLKNDALLSTFCTFGEDLISCVMGEKSEERALTKLRARFKTWIALFKKTRTPLSAEKAQGLYGELYYLNSELLCKYSADKAIEGWSGPEFYTKDFSIDDTWYEIKTVGVSSTIVKISSIQQLSSDVDGKLVVVRVEEMADSYEAPYSTINKLCQSIISKIEDSDTKDLFLNKLNDVGYDFSDDLGNKNYRVDKVEKYNVTENFPMIREKDIKYEAVNNVAYSLIINMIRDFKEISDDN